MAVGSRSVEALYLIQSGSGAVRCRKYVKELLMSFRKNSVSGSESDLFSSPNNTCFPAARDEAYTEDVAASPGQPINAQHLS